ncbi:60S ribosomal protein L27-B [Neolecta irregularis DAH-3]|uniref:60S ribosomal protein L27-B n=1 Tax=Neolecta irregularis (strain DAH-3) TaxID=1198029 RepID=A0A1U7LJR0_NEOID|nr:60S ribosomal protein L27-B [Neolecta irregularis DAH-3]|eukprot:OLL22761.1 60S ribosomal protein L27-B [Neolecta irregularis DAH-3]
MVKFIKTGKVVIITQGRHAGKKCVVIAQKDEGSKSHSFPHAIVAGIDKYPLKSTSRMSQKKIAKRSKVKPFIKIINYTHIMPTRYALDLESIKNVVSSETFKEPSMRRDAKKVLKNAFEEKYMAGKFSWFFTPLRF